MLITSSLLLFSAVLKANAATITTSSYLAQVSPVFPSKIPTPSGVVTSYQDGPYDTVSSLDTTPLEGFPTTWEIPPTDSDEVQTIYNSINWNKVPSAPVRKIKSDGSFSPSSDGSSDPYCYWSDTNCVKPKASYLPPDLYECPKKGDWGLTYDDGPFNKVSTSESYASVENSYAEPALYNFLGKKNIHASLFYIGSNVVTYPAAARLALNNGHSLCVHTWSHNPMTTLTNAEIVAELYWGIKAIKTATGVTPKCWRPPQGDVDDRVRSIAWQMGMRTVIWNEDTNDWDMPDPMNGGNLPSKTVDGYFQSWINAQKAGTLKTGILVLEHELNHMTVNMSMYWLPKLQSTFNVVSALECNGISQPYWETNFVYPVSDGTTTTTTTTTKTTTTTTKSATTTTKSATPTPNPACTSGSFGLENGDGYNGYCCKTQADCIDDCINGKCNGPANPNQSTTTTTTKSATPTSNPACTSGSFGLENGDGYNGYCCKTQADCIDDCINGKCNGPSNTKTTTTTKTSTKTTTKTSSKTTTKTTSTGASSSCVAGYKGKRKGNGPTGACCSSSDDCIETCRKGVCGL